MQTQQNQSPKNPSWWTESHTKGWDRVKEAFRRDWEQTKADLSKTKGQELNQQVGDTVKQAVGAETIPAGGRPNHAAGFEQVEQAYRYGHAARQQYGKGNSAPWAPELEDRLEKEWTGLGANQSWKEAKPSIEKAWNTQPKS
jgi:hypothetical protein